MLKATKIKLKITEMTEIDDDSDPRRRSRKRNFNSWDSDDELLQDDLLIKKTKGDQSDDELDEAALLGLSDSEDNGWNDDTTTTNDELPLEGNGTDHIDSLTNTEEEEFISNAGKFNDDDETEVDDSLDSSKDHTVPSQLADKTFDSVVNGSGTEDVLDIDITNEAFDDFDEDLDATTESNFKGEPEKETPERYEEPIQEKTQVLAEDDDVKVDAQEEHVEEKVDDANKSESSESEEEEEEDEKEESGRGRFKSERQPSVAVKPSVRSKRDIPETLELSQEAKEKLDEFNRKKEEEKQSKRNRRGGRGGYGPQRGNQQRGGFSQRGGRRDNFQTCGPGGDNIGNLSRMRFPCRPILNHDRRRNLPQGGPQIGPQGVPMGMNPTMFDQQEQHHIIRPQMHQPRPPLMQNPPLIQTPPRQPTPHQRLPMHPPASSMSAAVHKSEPNQQPNKIHINPHFKGTVQVSSQGQTWNNQNQQVPGIVTSSTTNVTAVPNQNRAPDNYNNRQQGPPVSSWNQAPRLTPSQTWTNPQQGQQHYRDHQPVVSSSHNFNAPSHHFSPPSQRVPDNQMPQQNSFQPRMQQPHQMRPPIPNQQHRPRAEFHTPQQQPNYRPQQHQPRFTTPPMHQQQHQQPNQHRPHLLNQPGMNPGQIRPRFPGPPQGPGQNYRQPSPQFRHQTPSPQKKAPPNYSPPPSSSPNLGSPQRTNPSPSPKQSPKLAAPPQTLIKEAVSKSSVAVAQDTNEDAETKRLRIQIEEQKKLREEIMKRKEERRQQLAAKRQEALKKRLAEQGHDVAEATKKLGLDPAPPAKQTANKTKKTPDGKKQGGGTPTKKLEQQMKQRLNQQQEQYAHQEYQQSQPKGYQPPQHQPEGHRQHQPEVYQHQPVGHRQPQPEVYQEPHQQPQPYQQPHTYQEPHHQQQDSSVKVWKQQQNLKVLVDEPRPIPTVGNQPAPMPTPQRTNTPPTNMRGHPARGRGRGRGRGFQHQQNQHQNNPTQNQQPFQQNFPPQQTGLQQVPVNQFQSPGYQQQNIVPQQVQQTRGGGNMRGREVRGTGRGRGQQMQRGSSHQPPARRGSASAGRGNFPGAGRGIHQPRQQQTPGNIQNQPAPARKSVKDRLGGAVTPNHQILQQVPPGNQQRVVIPPGQNIGQFQQRQQQVNHLEGARLVQTEAILNRVLIEGLSASTVTQGIIQMAKTVGSVQNCHFIPNQRKAFVTFHNPQHAYMFQKRYNRHMVDLSMINVSLIPAT